MLRKLSALFVFAFVGSTMAMTARAAESICVLYFDNNTGDASWDPLKKGLADMVVSDLSVVDGLTVVERSRLEDVLGELKLQRSSHFDPATAQKLGKLVGARYAVTGAISAVAPKIRLDVRLIEVQSGKVVAADKIVGAPDRFFELQGDLLALFTKSLGKALPSKQSGARLDRLDTALLYGRGLDLADKGDPEEASKALKDVVKNAPKFALGQKRYLDILARVQEAKAKRTTQLASGEQGLLQKCDAELKRGLPTKRSRAVLERYFGYRILRGNLLHGMAAKLGGEAKFGRDIALPSPKLAEAKRHMLAYVDNQVTLAKELAAVGRNDIPPFPKVDEDDKKTAQELGLGNSPDNHAFMSFQTIARSTARYIVFGEPDLFASFRAKVSPSLATMDSALGERAIDLLDQALVDIAKNEPNYAERETTRALTLYGDLLVALGRPAEGIARWQQILDDYPKSPEFADTEKKIRETLERAR